MGQEDKMNDDATQFSYFRDNELTQLADTMLDAESNDGTKSLKEGTVFLDKYKILKVLGEGSFSLIYLLEAINASKKLLVAKEFFPKGFVTRNEHNEVILKTSLSEKEIENYHFMKEIFIGEAKNLVKVSKRTHPNVLNFFALEENINNTMYLITDYEEGITLKEYVKERKKEHKGKLTAQEIKGIATGLLNGLSHIHKVNIYHQDIKLENILIRQDQYPLLLDFGASIILYDEKQKKYFNATTPRYAAPEQVDLAQPPKIDERTDIYELGVLLYKLITDEFPPKASERLQAKTEDKEDPYIALEIQKPYGYDSKMLKAVDKALKIDQKDRFQNTDDFKKAILQKTSYANFSMLWLALLLPALLVLMYMLWPASEGTVKINVDQQTYFVYSDGKKIHLSEEKTVLLSSGEHQLTIIKDGYIPYETNVTISGNNIVNLYGKLAPLKHTITLGTNISSALFMVDGRTLIGNTFEGQAGHRYKIRAIAENYSSETKEITYEELHKDDFEYYQELQPAQTQVNILIETPLGLGKNRIRVNGEILNSNTMIATYNEVYKIEVENPFYEKVSIQRSYEELSENTEQKIVLKQGYGEVVLKGLPSGVQVNVYKKHVNKNEKIDSQYVYTNKEYKVTIPAYDKLYMTLYKKEYEIINTPIFSLEHNAKNIQKYSLSKKVIPEKTIIKKNEVVKETEKESIALVPPKKVVKNEKPKKIIEAKKSVKILDKNVLNKRDTIKNLVSKKQVDSLSKLELVRKEKKVLNIKKEKETKQEIVKKAVTETIVKEPEEKLLVIDTPKKINNNKSIKKEQKKTIKYRIKRGDTLFTIARANRTTIEEVKKQNGLKAGEVLKLGRVLEVPVDTYFRTVIKEKRNSSKKIKSVKKIKKRVTVKKKRKLKKTVTSKFVWYCVAGANGNKTWSAKSSTKKGAHSAALRRCRRSKGNFCRVSSCYILGGS